MPKPTRLFVPRAGMLKIATLRQLKETGAVLLRSCGEDPIGSTMRERGVPMSDETAFFDELEQLRIRVRRTLGEDAYDTALATAFSLTCVSSAPSIPMHSPATSCPPTNSSTRRSLSTRR